MKKILLVMLLLGGCCWRSPNAEFYMMKQLQDEPVSSRKMVVHVSDIKSPDLFNRKQMVSYDKKNNQVHIMEFNRWAEVFPEVMQNAVVNDLAVLLPAAYVGRSNFDSRKADYNVNIEINQMQAYKDEGAKLSVWWNIANSKGNVLLQKQKEYEAKTTGSSIQDLVRAQNDAVNQLSKDIALHLIKL